MKKIIIILTVLILLLVTLIVARTLLHQPLSKSTADTVNISVDEKQLAKHMSEAVQFKTISFQSKELAIEEFSGFINWVFETYPEVQNNLEYEQLGGYSMLYKWTGKNPDLEPILLTGHYDVVPVIPGSEGLWDHAPFSGEIADDHVWGRGALDDKSAVISLLEAVTLLLKEGFQPERSIYLSFGHDEELGGTQGAASVVEYAKKHGINFLWSLDEGSFLFDKMIPGIDQIMGAINVAEKGSLTLQIVAKAAGGHSSAPPKQTAVGILAEAITKLETHPVPGGLEGLSAQMFDTISRYMPFTFRMLFANQWLFQGTIETRLADSPFMNAMLRTTTAPTMLSGSTKVNVLPIEAIATVNFRLHPRDSVGDIISHVKAVVDNDNIEVRVRENAGRPASQVSDWTSVGFDMLEKSVNEILKDTVIAPGVMIAGSDTRHYGKVSSNSFRFNPMTVTQKDVATFHGTNERISIANLAQATKIYSRLMINGSAP